MNLARCVLAAMLAVTATGCADRYYTGTRHGYTPGNSPNYAYAPNHSNETSYTRYNNSSMGDH